MIEVPNTNSVSSDFVQLKSEELQKNESKSQSSETNKAEKAFQGSTVQFIEQRPVIQMISKEAEYMFVFA
jgi:nucleoside diphosphate kinase